MNQARMRFPGGRLKALTLSYDDGVEQDIRLIEIMRARGVKGTFNLNSELFAPEGTLHAPGTIHRRMTRSQCLKTYAGDDIEVALHGAKHLSLNAVAPSNIMVDVLDDRRNLESMFGSIIRGMAYANGAYSDEAVDVLRLAGVVYSRTTQVRRDFDIPSDWLRLSATCHHNDDALNELTRKFTSETPKKAPWLFYLWGHSYEFDADDNWHVIEKFISDAGAREDIWYATNIEIFDYITAYQRLIYSADQKRVFNPTSTDVWTLIGSETVCVRAGREG